jgi:hypothetical protein
MVKDVGNEQEKQRKDKSDWIERTTVDVRTRGDTKKTLDQRDSPWSRVPCR